MAFRPPTFNAWAQVWRYSPIAEVYQLLGYSICQHRGPDPQWDGGVPGSSALASEVLFPARSDVRQQSMLDQSTWPDLVYVAGWNNFGVVVGSCPKGAGFTNEYLLVLVYFPGSSSWPGLGAVPRLLPCVTTALLPPGGFTPLPLVTPRPTWFAT